MRIVVKLFIDVHETQCGKTSQRTVEAISYFPNFQDSWIVNTFGVNPPRKAFSLLSFSQLPQINYLFEPFYRVLQRKSSIIWDCTPPVCVIGGCADQCGPWL